MASSLQTVVLDCCRLDANLNGLFHFCRHNLADHSLMGARLVLALLVAFLVTNVAVLYSSASSAATGGVATFALCRCPKVCV